MHLCMATRTLSVDEEAYRTLVRARSHATESFSKVIKRAKWDSGSRTCGDLLRRSAGRVNDEVLDRLDAAQHADKPPENPWSR